MRSPERHAVADRPSPFPVRHIQNPDMQRRIAALKDDPDFQEFFNDVQKNGPSAMMKYSNDAAFLKKLNDKLGGEDAIRAAVKDLKEKQSAE